jgi:hypothetical protein
LVLIFTCIETPYRISIGELNLTEEEQLINTKFSELLNFLVDSLFFLDILINFNSAYYDEDFVLVEQRKDIAKTYVSSWFFIDLIAIIPFELIMGGVGLNGVIRIARIGRLYRLVKLTKLLRVFKIVKEKSKLMSYL